MSQIDGTAGGQLQHHFKQTNIGEARCVSLSGTHVPQPSQAPSDVASCVSLSPLASVQTGEAACYPQPKIRLPRNAGEFSGAEDDKKDSLSAGLAAVGNISGAVIRHIIGPRVTATSGTGTTSLADWRLLPPPERLARSDAEITRLLRLQPDPQTVAAAAFRARLEQAFPAVPRPFNPDQIYITQYVEQDNIVTTSLSQTLSQALSQASIDYPADTTYNQSRTRFFRSANDVRGSNEIAGMKGSQHLLAFEKILREQADPDAHHRNYRQALRDFWNTANAALHGQTPAIRLSGFYGQQRLAEAQLRIGDGTLGSADEQWLTYLTDPVRATMQPGSFSLSLQDGTDHIPFAGVLVLTQRPSETPDTTSGPVLLGIPGQGLMKFESSAAYTEALQQLFDTTAQRDLLLMHVARDRRERAANIDNALDAAVSPFRYEEISGPEWTRLMQSLLNQKIQDITNVLAATRTTTPTDTLAATFDLSGMRHQREQLLLQQFLAPASASDKEAWFKELTHYRNAALKIQGSGFPGMHQYLDPGFLTRYARDHLREQIRNDLKLEVDPDQVIVTTHELLMAYTSRGDLPAPPRARQTEKVPTHSTLTELALANTRMLDQNWGNELPVKTRGGTALPQLTQAYLTRIIRAANIGQRYKEFLQSRLLDSPEGKAREKAYVDFSRARLQLDVREARIRGDITADAAQWVRSTMTTTPLQINQRSVYAQHLQIDRSTLNGILLFGTPPPVTLSSGMTRVEINSRVGTPKIVLYTPDAPDGKNLREYANRTQMVDDFINRSEMREYLRERIERSRQNEIDRMLQAGVDAPRVRSEAVDGNFLQVSYRTGVAHIIDDAETRTTDNDEADRQARWDKISHALDIAGILLPLKLSVPLSLIRLGHALHSANAARVRGDSDEALAGFINGISLALNVLSDGVGRLVVSTNQHLYPSRPAKHPAAGTANSIPVPPAAGPKSPAAPAGMSAVQIQGQPYFYWNTKNNIASYRDLFTWDQLHPGQLKAAGHGIADSNNVWKKIAPLSGGGGSAREPGVPPRPGASATASMTSAVTPTTMMTDNASVLIKKNQLHGRTFYAANIGSREYDLTFDLEKNAFRKIQNDLQTGDADSYYVIKNNTLQRLTDPERPVSDAERSATLRLLGINLKLPLDVTAPVNTAPIPTVIRGIWTGSGSLRPALVANLERNAVIAAPERADNLQHNAGGATPGKKYQTTLYLSNHNPVAYRRNLQLLRDKAPHVAVETLESSAFYQKFRTEHDGRYFSQYQAALNGNGGIAANNASAADVLRYRLMFHEGGLYMDLDDKLLQAPGDSELATTPDGLVLDTPQTMDVLGMDGQYGTNIFGTQKNNPTLNAISEESYRRYLQNSDLYTVARPRESTHSSAELSNYMQRISQVTGPAMFDHVIGEQLPAMRQLREALKLSNNISIDIPDRLQSQIEEWASERLVLNRINLPGNAHSWKEN